MDLDDLLAPSHTLGAQWSVSVLLGEDLAPIAAHRPEALLRTASVAKVFVLLELADRLSRATLASDTSCDRVTTTEVHDSGLWQSLRADHLAVGDLAVLVGAVSDNWATNALLDLCGLDRVQARAATLAPGGSTLHDYLRDDRSGDVPTAVSHGCAADWSMIMRRLHLADGIDETVCREVLGWLALDTDLSMVAAALDLDPLAHATDDLGLRLWHKTGTDAGVRADVGVVRSSTAVVSYSAICNWPETDTTPQTRRAVLSTMRRLGEYVRRVVTD